MHESPEAGISMRLGREYLRKVVPSPGWSSEITHFRLLDPSEVAKGYVHGWEFESPIIEMPLYLPWLMRLVRELGAIIETATRDVNQDMLDEYTARNNAALVELVDTHGVDVRPFPKEVTDAFRKIAVEVLTEQAAEDAQFAKVYQSFKSFQDQVSRYHQISEVANYASRQ